MPESNSQEAMTPTRLAAVLNAYGASPERWPEAERASATALISSNPHLQAEADRARELDAVLDTAPMVTVPAELYGRILAGFDRIAAQPSVRRFLNRIANVVWPDAPLWQPSTALAMSLVAGLVLGVMAPVAGATQHRSSDMTVAFEMPQSSDDGL
ncbi:MAG TPA: hypothetical protein VGG36_09180 [Rhizomicrobium sp.]|jgi:hypothetical protein